MSVKYYIAFEDRDMKVVIDESWDYVEVLTSAQRHARHENEKYFIYEYDEYENPIELDGRVYKIETFLENPKLIQEHTI